jgi:5-carboxymethyl-2-hydroxymuconic-semialdehyde dehydrogenase
MKQAIPNLALPPTIKGLVCHFIDGKFVESRDGASFDTLDPRTNMPFARIARGSAEDIDRAVIAARRAFDAGPWPRIKPRDRAAILRRIADGIERNVEMLALHETLDTGLPITQARQQIARSADNFSFFADLIPHVYGCAYPVDQSFLNYSIRKPVGVAGLITPWNIPLMQASWKIGPCLAGGNTCVLKPAEWSPITANLFSSIVQDADLPPGVFNVVHGFGEPAGAALVAHPAVNLISFTGETTTGQTIIANGARTLKRFSMELGGKSPVVIFADADLDRAVDGTIFGVYSMNGERCTAGSRLLVQRSIYERFLAEFSARAENIRVGDPFDVKTEVGPLIHPEHYQRVNNYVEAGRLEGARLLTGGCQPANTPQGNYLRPTLFADATREMRVFQEEIFGPVVVALPFDDEKEAVRLANDVRYGLAAYVWTNQVARAHRVSQAIDSGLVYVNSHNVRDLRVPFGGAKDSGIGREGGVFSFDFYTEFQSIHVATGEHVIPRLGIK